MSKKKDDAAAAEEAAARPIPNPPGGGSWTFDHAKHEWVSNEPAAPAEVVDPAQE